MNADSETAMNAAVQPAMRASSVLAMRADSVPAMQADPQFRRFQIGSSRPIGRQLLQPLRQQGLLPC
jgi:hypothetical protein